MFCIPRYLETTLIELSVSHVIDVFARLFALAILPRLQVPITLKLLLPRFMTSPHVAIRDHVKQLKLN